MAFWIQQQIFKLKDLITIRIRKMEIVIGEQSQIPIILSIKNFLFALNNEYCK